jgi:arabinofuranosyltransferase
MPRGSLLVTLPIVILVWLAAVWLFQLQRDHDPARARFNVRWVEGLTVAERRAAEQALDLRDGEQVGGDTWTYRIATRSRDAVERIVRAPLVADTFHIDRDDFRVLIEAPELPRWLRWLIETSRIGLLAWGLVAVGVVAIWYAHQAWARALLAAVGRLRPGERRVRVALLIVAVLGVYVAELVRTAWLSDDAAITLRTVMNLVHGYGARFNVDERVQAYTHPLWFLIVSGATVVAGNVFIVTLLLSGLLSLGAVCLVLRASRTAATGLLVVTGLLLSKAFVDFSTSGLENPLAHVVVLVTALAALHDEERDPRRWWFACAGLAAAYLTRPDLVLLVGPVVAVAALRHRASARSLLFGASIALVPILVWTVGATGYYGFPFPNPAYAKLGPGIPWSARMFQGARYLAHSVPRDPITLALIVLGIAAGAARQGVHRAMAAGVVLYLLYVVSVGGDFMEGRFLTCALVLSALALVSSPATRVQQLATGLVVLGLGAVALPSTLLSGASYEERTIPPDGIADERGVYFQEYGWLTADAGTFDDRPWRDTPGGTRRVEVTCGGVGWLGIEGGPSLHVIDTCALADPLLAHLPARPDARWRIGHIVRELPDGYEASVRDGVNLLTDPGLSRYYESIRRVTRGPLGDPARVLDILHLNTQSAP